MFLGFLPFWTTGKLVCILSRSPYFAQHAVNHMHCAIGIMNKTNIIHNRSQPDRSLAQFTSIIHSQEFCCFSFGNFYNRIFGDSWDFFYFCMIARLTKFVFITGSRFVLNHQLLLAWCICSCELLLSPSEIIFFRTQLTECWSMRSETVATSPSNGWTSDR